MPTPVTTTVVGVHCLRHNQCTLIACWITTRGFRVLQRAVTLLVHRFSCIFLYLYFFATTVRAHGLLYIVVHTKPVTAYVVRAVLLQAVWPPHALFCASKALWGKFWVGAVAPVSPSIPPTGCQDGSGSLRKHCGSGFFSQPSTSGTHPYADGRSSGSSVRNNGRQHTRQGSRHQTNAPLALPAPSTAPTSTALVSAPSPAMRYGPTHAANTNPNARQPGTFTTRRN